MPSTDHQEQDNNKGRGTPLPPPQKNTTSLPSACAYQACGASAKGLEKPVCLVGQAQVRPAQLQQELNQRGGAHEVAEGDHDAQLGQVKLHLRDNGAPQGGRSRPGQGRAEHGAKEKTRSNHTGKEEENKSKHA